MSVEEHLVEAQRLASVGLLAGGIAHDFNNVLTVILTSVALLQERLADRPDAREDLREIEVAARWGAALTRQLLAYARKQSRQSQVVDLNELTARTERLLRRLIGEHIEVTTRLLSSPGLVRGDPAQIEQVLVNLGLNARDAMPAGGRLTIETAEMDEGCVGVTISDTGHGMTPDVMARIGEPLFTTKPHGRGTGLGLAVSYSIVRQNGGNIEVSTEPGKGTVFRLSFPRVESVVPPAPAPAKVPTPCGTETILVAEDEAMVRRSAVRTLEAAGYTVLEAAHGLEARELAERHAGPVHLLVTDLIMPHVSGRVLADELRQAQPELRVIFTSGYPADALAEATRVDGAGILTKPYEPGCLARRVREILDGGDYQATP